jgi:hypothetical protein
VSVSDILRINSTAFDTVFVRNPKRYMYINVSIIDIAISRESTPISCQAKNICVGKLKVKELYTNMVGRSDVINEKTGNYNHTDRNEEELTC